MAERQKARCGCLADEEQLCSVCLEHLCGGEKNLSLCFHCRTDHAVIAGLPRRADGAILDPVKLTPLTLCKCGAVYNQTCVMEINFNKSPYHDIIRDNRGFTAHKAPAVLNQ
jgi:hypothetical protein